MLFNVRDTLTFTIVLALHQLACYSVAACLFALIASVVSSSIFYFSSFPF